eukprot:TRINITY_DN5815_c0_g1_i1.p2 TRINITY_DN5815_c0_g1~~TRINITY_DN5815_c0_g1_i1.p2  ORF type:complete len:720 (+),score=291.97 TRINITY_DN5815_c0_g1_i1:26-2161(+)
MSARAMDPAEARAALGIDQAPQSSQSFTGLDMNFDDLDITNEVVDFREIDALMSKFQEDPSVKEALDKGIDMREYSRQIEKELRKAERESIEDYLREAENFSQLHHQIKECDTVLERMENLLSGFMNDLGNISDEIRSLQDQSSSMSVKLQNRQKVSSQVTKFVQEITVSPDLVNQICNAPVDEKYMTYARTLQHKILLVQKQMEQNVAACADMEPQLDKLRIKAVVKIREFLLQQVYSLKKPGANPPMIIANELTRYAWFSSFLYRFARDYFVEIRDVYVDIMLKLYSSKFREYLTGLMNLHNRIDIGSKNDLIGLPEGLLKGFFSDRFNRNRVSVYALGHRAAMMSPLEALNAPPIVLHEAQKAKLLLPYEDIFRVLCKYFNDCVLTEYQFDQKFFVKIEMFKAIFGGAIHLFLDNVTAQVTNSYDAIGMLINMRVAMFFQEEVKELVPPAAAFYDDLLGLFWPRLLFVLNLHCESMKNADPSHFGSSIDTHHHFVTRRYAEFAAALTYLGKDMGDSRLAKPLSTLRALMVRFLTKMSNLHSSAKNKIVFYINNVDHILTVFETQQVPADRYQEWTNLMEQNIAKFVEIEVNEHFGDLLLFVKEHQRLLSPDSPDSSPPPEVAERFQTQVQKFAATWMGKIEVIKTETVASLFTNFLTGSEILKKVLAELILYYTRFEEIIRVAFKRSFSGFVPTSEVTYQIKRSVPEF